MIEKKRNMKTNVVGEFTSNQIVEKETTDRNMRNLIRNEVQKMMSSTQDSPSSYCNVIFDFIGNSTTLKHQIVDFSKKLNGFLIVVFPIILVHKNICSPAYLV